MASAATEPVQGTWKKKPCVPGTAKDGHCPRSPTPCLWPPCPPLTTLRPTKHTVLDLDSAVKWLEGSRGQLGGRWGRLSSPGDFYKPSPASLRGNFGSEGT